ncbi:unnamed protein product [Urochloa humidicola]
MLQEKFSSILEERMLNNKKIAGAVGICSNATITRNMPVLTPHTTLPSKFGQNGKKIDSSLPILNPGNQESSLIEPKKPDGEQARGIIGSDLKVSPVFTSLAKVPKNSETKRDRNGASNATIADKNK